MRPRRSTSESVATRVARILEAPEEVISNQGPVISGEEETDPAAGEIACQGEASERSLVLSRPAAGELGAQLAFLPVGRRLIEAFLTGRKPTTLRAYRRDLNDFRHFLSGQATGNGQQATGRLAEVIEAFLSRGPGPANELALRWRGAMLDKGLSPATINRRLAALRSLVAAAKLLGMVNWELGVPGLPHRAYRDTRGPGLDGFRAVLASERGTGAGCVRNRAILRLLFDLGLRREEVSALDVADVDFARGKVTILGKGRTERELRSMPRETAEAIAGWLQVRRRIVAGPAGGDSARPECGALFLNLDRSAKGSGRLSGNGIWRIVRDAGRRAELGSPVSPHRIRHTAISQVVRVSQAMGLGLNEARQFSRHANLATLQLYLDQEENVEGKLAAAIAAKVVAPPAET